MNHSEKPELIEQHRCHQGWWRRYRHGSDACRCDMTFSLYSPPQAEQGSVPLLLWLSGLTCTDENFVNKAGAEAAAAELGIALLVPDTSPRGDEVPDDKDYDLGQGAGYYLNATAEPWSRHFHMESYLLEELLPLMSSAFAFDAHRISIAGHSMGGHGALTLALKHPEKFRSVSAFAPICAPAHCDWGRKALSAYLGEEKMAWLKHDASELIKTAAPMPLRIDQGGDDEFLEQQLHPQRLLDNADFPVEYHLRDGYDHSYFFIRSFIGDQLRFHGRYLRNA